MTTVGQTINALQEELCHYIEATYHIGHPNLVRERRRLLAEPGTVYQVPFLESTPRYIKVESFSKLGLPDAVMGVLEEGVGAGLLHDPPYQHQAESLKKTLIENRDILVMTGTGSGKTECFLLPILGKFAIEAARHPDNFKEQNALRAIVLYPMNALVNDQLGRLRLLFGNNRIVDNFKQSAGRPTRFARYTSRTLYPGIRTTQKDSARLDPIGKYFVEHLRTATESEGAEQERAQTLIAALEERGKWPKKQNLLEWFGRKGQRWKDRDGNFKRCVTLPDDCELLTRHEVLASPPDLLVTNYSMLEYMLMRPIERPIFDRTAEWLHKNPSEKILIVVDEAHLYRGAAGAEVALLLRRLQARLGVRSDRFQFICTSASFDDPEYAREFAASLTGKSRDGFDIIRGQLDKRVDAKAGTRSDADILAKIDLDAFYKANGENRLDYVSDFLKYRSVKSEGPLHKTLYEALRSYGPMGTLINLTMGEAVSLEKLGASIFPEVDSNASDKATSVLIALGSLAREEEHLPGLLPCRVHALFRGLPGLWACVDHNCSELEEELRGGPTGKLYSQPRDTCGCGARVFEFFTCRNCGAAYMRAYTDNLEDPRFLWAEPGNRIRTERGELRELHPIDLLLEEPSRTKEPTPEDFILDIVTGRGNPSNLGSRHRTVYIQPERIQEDIAGFSDRGAGQFFPCGVCNGTGGPNKSSVQDHQTKGDEPFQALVSKQIGVQPPGPQSASRFAPLRGRKCLVFSDSRQTAARLAPNLKNLSMKDALRPLLLAGYSRLSRFDDLRDVLCLDHSYFALLLAAQETGVRLRPEIRQGDQTDHESILREQINFGILEDSVRMQRLLERATRNWRPPVSLLNNIYDVLFHKHFGVEPLALGSIASTIEAREELLRSLPDIPGLAVNENEKVALLDMWLRHWTRPRQRIWLSNCPEDWQQRSDDRTNRYIEPHSTGYFSKFETNFLRAREMKQNFRNNWLPHLLRTFCTQVQGGGYRLRGDLVTLKTNGEWAYCNVCRTTQRPFPNRSECIQCQKDALQVIDPSADDVFTARKGYFRKTTSDLINNNLPPIALIAAEHTAQLNAAQAEDVFSKAEEYELLFQDVDLDGSDQGNSGRPAVDVLSCTTTMEVGIDIGNLSGVALRNMPPSRANYQQRAGRAGRRANAVATVIGFASSDSHDEYFFKEPELMISGPVSDPLLSLDNYDIARRHVTAYLLQRYHGDRCRNITPENQPANLFSVLGTVANFRTDDAILNRRDFDRWLEDNLEALRNEISHWLPSQLKSEDRVRLLRDLLSETSSAIREAVDFDANLED